MKNIKKNYLTVLFILLLLFTQAALAAQLTVQKQLDKQNIKTEDEVNVILNFENPFGKELPIKIVDKTVFGNNGFDIQCAEKTLPADKETSLQYGPIKPFAGGTYDLDTAEISYTNPETGEEETVKSNTFSVEVIESQAQQGQSQGITTIYQCNGRSIQTTSYSSSGSSVNIQTGFNNQQSTQQSQSAQDRVQNNQLNQDTKAIKQQMQKQAEEQKQMEEEFKKSLEANKEFKKEQEELASSGYTRKDVNVNAADANSGSFEATYQTQGGNTATIKGRMENGEMKEIMTQTPKDREKMLQALNENAQYQQYKKQIESQGFKQAQTTFNQITQNHTKIETVFKNHEGQEKKITADYIDETIKNVSLEGDKEEPGPSPIWLLPIAAIIAFLAWLAYRKFFRKQKKQVVKEQTPEQKKPVDFAKEAKKMLSLAEKLFQKKRKKDAYEKVSQAIRYYFQCKHGIGKETTNTELLRQLKNREAENTEEIKKCLNKCSMVEFAKHVPTKKEFNELVQEARKQVEEEASRKSAITESKED